MSDHAWMELCQVSTTILAELKAQSSLDEHEVIVCLERQQLPRLKQHSELTTLILEALPLQQQHRADTCSSLCYVSPLLYDFLVEAAAAAAEQMEQGSTCTAQQAMQADIESAPSEPRRQVPVSIAPLLVHQDFNRSIIHSSVVSSEQQPATWTLSRMRNRVEPLPLASTISLCCVYSEVANVVIAKSSSLLENQLSLALEGRLIRINTLLALPTLSCVYLVTVTNIKVDGVLTATDEVVYRVGSNSDFTLNVVHHLDCSSTTFSHEQSFMKSEWEQHSPGYEGLLQQLVALSLFSGVSAPAGVLLTGCSGVGKTHLASCLAFQLESFHSIQVHWVSAQDLLMQASWATEANLLQLMLPPASEKRCLLVLDDLQILARRDEEDASYHDPEVLLVHNSILATLARLSSITPSAMVIGIAHDSSQLPREFVRIGRLEKEIRMDPPTQTQREEILVAILQDVKDSEKSLKWAETLASQTAGCVASDLRQLSADAWTRAWSRASVCSNASVVIAWHDLSEAARTCIPSQLEQLDVTKTPVYPHDDGRGTPPEPAQIHKWSWRNFGGYHDVKKRLYRTVVMPWRRFISSTSGRFNDSESSMNQVEKSWVDPPSGVLFHGPPGVGKTLAASCLASSLGLHVVKVRASDALDQWLGGSEAAIRSLFARARAASPCILFFDEIDAIACNREDDGSSIDVTSRILTTFLNEMDGVSSNASSGVLVVACTNRLETLDAALLRPGRLDEHVLLTVPSQSDVSDILKLCLQRVPLSEDVNIAELAELFVELDATGADIDGVCRDACLRVIRDAPNLSSALSVSQKDLIDAIRDWKK